MTEINVDTPSSASSHQQQQPVTSSGNEQDAQQSLNSSMQGINIHDALEILADRSSSAASSSQRNENQTPSSSNNKPAACACHGQAPPPNAASMGQTLHISGLAADDENDQARLKAQADALQQKVQEERAARQSQLVEKLQSMSIRELLKTVLETQEQRVMTYRDYDSGLKQVLQTGNMTHYPNICATATASFSVFSDTIRSVESVLKQQKRSDLVDIIRRLQEGEKNKLNLTAALHLEQIRENCQLQLSTMDSSANDEKVANLMKKDVQSLQRQIATCVQEINDVLEELRCSLLDEE